MIPKACSRQLYRGVYSEIWEKLWTSGRSLTQGRSISGIVGRSLPKERGTCSGLLWEGRSSRAGPEGMVRRADLFGGWREMGIIQRPAARAAEHGLREPLPEPDGSPRKIEEQHRDEFLRQARHEQAQKIIDTERAVGGIPGVSLAAADTEYENKLGENNATIEKEVSEEFIRRSEAKPSLRDEADIDNFDNSTRLYSDTNASPWTLEETTTAEEAAPSSRLSESGTHPDPNGDQNPSVNEEVKRGLIADSELPLGRTDTAPKGASGRRVLAGDEHDATEAEAPPEGEDSRVGTGVAQVENWDSNRS